jgi:8-oxo-dGTP pyrophosphatase MutT (NUDIX family)
MEINLEPSEVPTRASATVVMLRDGADGLEVFLLKRHGLSDVLGGAYVFPGGKVDSDDELAEVHELMDQAPAQLVDALHESDPGAVSAPALYFAALREVFEEAGVLFAPGTGLREAQAAWHLLREGRAFDEVVRELGLRLAASELLPWSRWVTPIVGGVIRKRFDTRFFLARVPHGQLPRHDNHEATESAWLAPREALRQYWERTIELAPPQIMSLAHLSRHATVDSAFADARMRRPPLVHPQPFEQEGMRFVCYPGDERHPVRERALPGPTRLLYLERRFEPPGGFESLFRDA